MIRKNEYHCLPHGAAVAQMQTISILHQVRARAAPACSPEPPQKTVCHQFPRCEGCAVRSSVKSAESNRKQMRYLNPHESCSEVDGVAYMPEVNKLPMVSM